MPIAHFGRAMRSAPGQVVLDDLLRVCSSEGQINRALLKEMLGLFIQENERRVRSAVVAADSHDRAALLAVVHAIKGSAALVGARHLQDLANVLELRLSGDPANNLQASARQLRDEFSAVVETLKDLYPDLGAD